MRESKIKTLESKNKEIAEKLKIAKEATRFVNEMTKTPYNAMDMQEVSKILGVSKMDKNRLYAFLRNEGILTMANHPYQEYIDRGYFAVVLHNSPVSYGINARAKVLVYPSGLKFIYELIRKYTKTDIKQSSFRFIQSKQQTESKKETLVKQTTADKFSALVKEGIVVDSIY